jgi:hypothetical protein
VVTALCFMIEQSGEPGWPAFRPAEFVRKTSVVWRNFQRRRPEDFAD